MGPTISLIHSTARLPDGWRRAHQVWKDQCSDWSKVEYILGVDADQMEALYNTTWDPPWPSEWIEGIDVRVNPNRSSAVECWNYIASKAFGKILVTVADDWFPPEHWDTDLIEAIPNLDAEHVVAVDNQDNSNMLAFSILTKAYYDRYGYIFHPDYDGLMADQEFTEQVARDGVLVGAKYMKFRHLNPERGDAPWDEIYQKHRGGEALATGQKIYLLRKQRGFPKERLIQWVDNVPMPIDKISKSVVG